MRWYRMDRQQIEIVIKPDGTVEEQVSGIVGPDCESLTESFEKALGIVVEREKKAEFYNKAQKHTGKVTTGV
jgi:hypothetical protein